jgi:RNA polymerase sigma-70 factor, ECF subfamily
VQNDGELLNQVKSGNTQAFESLFKSYYGALVGYGGTIVKDADEAEDIVQQVFISVWEKRSSIEIHTSFRAMLYKAVYNSCLNRIKHNEVKRSYAREIKLSSSSSFSPADVQHKELQKKINDAIDQLPDQCAKIFKMSRFDYLKYQEIADKMGLSVKTVENQMGKALKLLRETMKDYLVLLIMVVLKRYL